MTPQRVKLIDAFMAFLVVVGGLQFVYCVVVGNYVSFFSFGLIVVVLWGLRVLGGEGWGEWRVESVRAKREREGGEDGKGGVFTCVD